jgi:Ca-activated chloride channel family protein
VTFARPLWLLGGLALVVAALALYRFAERGTARGVLLYTNLDFMLAAAQPSRLPSFVFLAGWVGGAVALAIALGSPRVWTLVPVPDGTALLCIDTSGSMAAHDLEPSRAGAATAAALQFLDGVAPGTRVGIITFATNAQLVQTPTSDLGAVRDALARVPTPNGATAIGDALALAGQTLPAHGRRVVVLMTDGVNNRGRDPIEAAQALGARGIGVYTVGIGTSGSGELIAGTSETADLDEEGLRAMAQDGGGFYVGAHDASALRAAFGALARATVWEPHAVDASFPFAWGGGFVVLATLLSGFSLGKLS